MRCLVGLALFLVFYFGSCKIVGDVVAAITLRSGQGYSQRGAQFVGAEFVHKPFRPEELTAAVNRAAAAAGG